jgi:hypothetical protein
MCEVTETPKWYRLGGGHICRKCYRNLHRAKNKDRINEYQNQRRRMQPPKSAEEKEQLNQYGSLWYIKNKEKRKKQMKRWETKNRVRRNKRKAQLRKNNINCNIACNLRGRLSKLLKGRVKVGSAVRDLGCTVEFLKQYLESKFQLGMTWENYGNKKGQWSIDHIVPLSSVDLTDREQFLKVCHYTNLQPLWHIDNLIKGNRIV